MHSSVLTLLTCAVTLITASSFVYSEAVPLHRRQEPGTPAYDCHSNCGSVIQIARTEDYCASSNLTTQLTACLNCANEFDIWRFYGESVEAVASACGIAAVPVAVNATTSVVVSMTGTGSASTTATDASPTEITTALDSVTLPVASTTESAASAATSAAAGSRNMLEYGLAILPIGVAMMGSC